MPDWNRTHLEDLRAAALLVVDATAGVAGIVERMHATIQRTPGPLGRAVTEPARGLAGLVYRSVAAGIRLVGHGLDAGLAPLARSLREGEPTPARDAWVAVLNGVWGDTLVLRRNPLAIGMRLFAPRTFRGSRVVVLVHGLCLDERSWRRNGHDHGAALARDLSVTPVYARYNTGLPVLENGRALAAQLEAMVAEWPAPLEELALVGHSMGGLVARAAYTAAIDAGHAWPDRLRKVVFLGTPHLGAPLERAGHALDRALGLSPYSAPLTAIGKRRSAGITDLRHGLETRRLPRQVRTYAIAGSLAARRATPGACLIGDGLVPVSSALGRHPDRQRALGLPQSRQWVGYSMGHLELLGRPDVYARLKAWMEDTNPG